MPPDATAIARVLEASGAGVSACSVEPVGLVCRVVKPSDVTPTLRALAEEADFRVWVDLVGIDTAEAIELVYHVRSISRDEDVFVRALLPYGGEIPSVWDVFPGAIYTEREVAELLGVTFGGHPNPKRLLTTDDIGDTYLLRKSVPIREHDDMTRPGVPPRGGAAG